MSLRVAVTGATGTVGTALLAQLAARDDIGAVTAVASRERPLRRMPAGVTYVAVDVRDRRGLDRALRGADAVVHLAFSLYGVRRGGRALHDINVGGSANVVAAARAAGARRLVYTSSAVVYGPGPPGRPPIDETAAVRPDERHFYARHKGEVERLLRGPAGSGLELVVLRPCAVVGPHAFGAAAHGLPRPLPGVADLGRAAFGAGLLRPWVVGPGVPLQFVHEADVAAAIVAALVGDDVAGTYNLAGDGALDGGEVVRALGLRSLPVPAAAVRAATRLLAAAPVPPVPAGQWPWLLTYPLLLDTTAARTRLGWRPRHDSVAALVSLRAALSA